MGWTFLYDAPEKKHVIEDCTRGSDKLKCVRKAVHGNELWTIWHNTETNTKYIVLFLLARRDGNWGYKDMTEAMGPYYYQCPLSFLAEVPAADEEWREKVRQFHDQKKLNRQLVKEIRAGKIVKLRDSNPSEFRVLETKPLIGLALENRRRYKLVKSRIVEVRDDPDTTWTRVADV
jgi:hypothetical protein